MFRLSTDVLCLLNCVDFSSILFLNIRQKASVIFSPVFCLMGSAQTYLLKMFMALKM